MPSDISVVTLHQGRPRHLQRLLEGLSAAMFRGDVVIAEMGAVSQLPPLPFSVKQVAVDTGRLPLAHARNAGRRAALGSRLVFLDVDCIPERNLVTTLADHLDQQDAFVCALVRYLTSEVQDGWTYSDLHHCSRVHPDRSFPTSGAHEAAHPGLFWSLAFAVRVDTFDRLGGFDETFTGYGGEDTDLAFRARNAGIPIMLCADAVAYHQPHESFEPPVQHFTDVMRNAAIFHARHGEWPMEGWLEAFRRLGLIEREANDSYRILRMPTDQDFLGATTPGTGSSGIE